jgi:hypothetical protein
MHKKKACNEALVLKSIKVKVKVNFTPEETTKFPRGVDVQLYHFFNFGIRGDGWSVPNPGGFTTRK